MECARVNVDWNLAMGLPKVWEWYGPLSKTSQDDIGVIISLADDPKITIGMEVYLPAMTVVEGGRKFMFKELIHHDNGQDFWLCVRGALFSNILAKEAVITAAYVERYVVPYAWPTRTHKHMCIRTMCSSCARTTPMGLSFVKQAESYSQCRFSPL